MNRTRNRNAIESLEARQLMHATLIGSDVLTLSAVDGTKNNGNDVVIRFDSGIKSPDVSKIRAFGYSNNTINGGQNKTTINILSATVSGNNLVLRTDVQVRKGSTVTFNSGALTAADNEPFTGSTKLTKGLNRDRFTLALRAFSANDKTLFSSTNVTGGSVETTANTEPSSSSVRTAFSAFLDKKISEGSITSAQKTSSLARFDSSATIAKVPSANLRAAILSLIGTVGEPAIAYYLDASNSTGKDFSSIIIDGGGFSGALPVAETKYTSTGKLRFTLNPNYAGESFVVLSGRMAHEAVHEGKADVGGQTDSQDEEVIANFIETTVYAQQVVTDFTYAQRHTTLTGQANYRLLLMLNSGDRQFPRVGIKAAPLLGSNVTAIPGFTPNYNSRPTVPIESFERDVREEFIDRNIADKPPTTSYPTGRAMLANITGNTYTSATTYGDALIADVDISQDTLGDAFAMRVARVLQVKV